MTTRERLRDWWCRLNGGHELYMHWSSDRVCRECVLCGHQTTGWYVPADPRHGRRRV